MRADAVVSLVRVRECRKCSQQYRAPMPVGATLLIVFIGLGMMVWLGVRALQLRFDRYQLMDETAALVLAAVGLFVVFYGLFKLVFQRGVKPPERQDWRERREPLPPAMPVGNSIVAVPVVQPFGVLAYGSGGESAATVAAPAPPRAAPPAAPRSMPAPRPAPAAPAPIAAPVAGPPPTVVARAVTQVQGLPMPSGPVLAVLRKGGVIPAHALAINARREFNERRTRGLTRYYLAAGVQGVAVGVHTTQYAIRKQKYNLLKPVLEIVGQELRHHEAVSGKPLVKIAGICGPTRQAVAEAELAAGLGYDIGLVNMSALPADANEYELVDHCKRIGKIIPLMGFYLQPAVGGRELPYGFWRALADVPNLVAIKIAAFNRYRTVEVMRAIAESGRALTPGWTRASAGANENPIAIYTGNDDHIVGDLLGEWSFDVNGTQVSHRIVGGLLGHWACWTRAAVQTFEMLHQARESGSIPPAATELGRQITDMNGAVFDARNNFKGCIAGINEVLFRQGMLEGNECLEPTDVLSPGQAEEITRVIQSYPHLMDDEFIHANRDQWMEGI